MRRENDTVKLIMTFTPKLIITPLALRKITAATDYFSTEVGGFGTVIRLSDEEFLLKDMYFPKQEVHATTTEISPEGTLDLYDELGDEVQDLRLHWHSHVNMGVSPSGQDDTMWDSHIQAQGEDGFFFRVISNKKGIMKVDLWLPDTELKYLNIPFQVEQPELGQDFYDMLDANVSKITYKKKKGGYSKNFRGGHTTYWDKYDDSDEVCPNCDILGRIVRLNKDGTCPQCDDL